MTTPATPALSTHAPERAMLRRAWRDTAVLLAGLAVVGGIVGALTDGVRGVAAALVGVAIAAIFCGVTIWSMHRTIGMSPVQMAAIVMGSWLVKVVALIVVLVILRATGFYSPGHVRWVLFGVLALGAIGSALLDYRAVAGARLPYVQP